MDTPREIELFSAGMRPRMWLGADRRFAVMTGALCLMLAGFGVAMKLWFLLALVPVLFVIAILALRDCATKDPLYFEVYWRAMRYADFYAAKSGLHTKRVRQLPKGWV